MKFGDKMAKNIELWPVERLQPYAKNARTHSDAQVAQIAASIVEFGFTNPILVDSHDGIIAGHGRLMAAKSLGLADVPVIVLDHLTDAQRRAYIIADNKLALNAGWDEKLLAEELAALKNDGFDLGLTGFGDEELDALLPDVIDPAGSGDPDAAPAVEAIPVSVTGDVWVLGRHRLLCGDSTSIDDLERLLAGEQAECIWTDPPYNVAVDGIAGKIANDDMSDSDFAQFLSDVFTAAAAVTKPGGACYVAHSKTERMNFTKAFLDAGFHLSGNLIWRKNTFTLSRSDYQWQHEPILYGWKEGAAHRWYGGRNKTSILEFGGLPFEQIGENKWQFVMGETALVISGEGLQVEELRGSVLFEEKPARNSDHPTMKPVALVERMLSNSAKKGDVVLDMFGGSGSTMIACERLNMRAHLMELDPKFCDVIVKRWQEFTGREAIHEESTQTFAELDGQRLGKKAKRKAA